MVRGVNVSQEMIDFVFGNEDLCSKYPDPKKAKSICESRMTGEVYTKISKDHEVSQFYCINCVKKTIRLYQLFGEENSNS